jgi:hypothetical protein
MMKQSVWGFAVTVVLLMAPAGFADQTIVLQPGSVMTIRPGEETQIACGGTATPQTIRNCDCLEGLGDGDRYRRLFLFVSNAVTGKLLNQRELGRYRYEDCESKLAANPLCK